MLIKKLKNLFPITFVTMVVVIATSLLVALENITRVSLEARQDQETLELLQGIFPEANYYNFDNDTEIYTLYNNNRNEIGYAFYGEGWGWGGKIVVLIGLEDTEIIKGIIVISQTETKYCWDLLFYYGFFEQFNSLKIENCNLRQFNVEGAQVDAATGATISSRGVVNAIREAALEKIEYLD